MASRRVSVLPPDGDDDAALRRALGQVAAHSEAPAPPPAPSIPMAPVAANPPGKVTVSVRMSPVTHAQLAGIGQAIGWSSNKIMTALVERQAEKLAAVFTAEGEAGVLRMLRGG